MIDSRVFSSVVLLLLPAVKIDYEYCSPPPLMILLCCSVALSDIMEATVPGRHAGVLAPQF
jgi:hypothetical protein